MASRFGNITRALLMSRGCPLDLVEQAMKALPVEVPATVDEVLADIDAAIGTAMDRAMDEAIESVAPTSRVQEAQIEAPRDVAEEIAAAIEAKADDLPWEPTVAALNRDLNQISAVRDMVLDEIHDCAAIARSFKAAP